MTRCFRPSSCGRFLTVAFEEAAVTTPTSERITTLMLALPTKEEISGATDDELQALRNVSNLLDNMAYLEVLKRKEKQS